MASTASVKVAVTGEPEARRARDSGPDSASERLAGCHDFAPVVMAAMAADVMRPLQLATIGALGMGFLGHRMVAAAHPTT
jgi:hypothetical protein